MYYTRSVDVHTHCGYQTMLEEAIAIVMAPNDRCAFVDVFASSTCMYVHKNTNVQMCTRTRTHTRTHTHTHTCIHTYVNTRAYTGVSGVAYLGCLPPVALSWYNAATCAAFTHIHPQTLDRSCTSCVVTCT
jgi:hypothetical protein